MDSSTEKVNTGVLVDIPVGAYYCFTATALFNNNSASWVGIGNNSGVNSCYSNANSGLNHATCAQSGYAPLGDTFYIYAQWSKASSNKIVIKGFYILPES